jgi:hypothetical protein
MSMHLVGPWLTTTGTKKRKGGKKTELVRKHKPISNPMNKIPSLATPPGRSTAHIKSLDPTNMSPALVHSIMDPKELAKESPETRAAIIAKSQRLAPAYNKGAFQYITDGADMSDIGRKK